MTIPVYTKEIEAGIAELIRNDNTLAMASTVKVGQPTDLERAIANLELKNNTQPDLFYFESILVSTGWNKNDDVFSKAELLQAKDTPVDKKINLMHNEADIIGHMVTSAIYSGDMRVPDNVDLNSIPDDIDIVVGGVLYKIWENPDLQARMNKMLGDIGAGLWYVSMECVFPDFDYAIQTPTGEHKTIARTEETSFLTAFLRKYGGEGYYEGYKIGRLLKNLIFTGKGIVDNPANPKSFITKTEISQFLGTAASIKILPEKVMITQEVYDEAQKKIGQLEKSLASEQEVVKAKDEAIKAKDESAKAEKAKLESDLAIAKEIVTANEAKIKKYEEDLAKANEALNLAAEEAAKAMKAEKKAKRMAQMASVEVDSAKAEELVEKFLDSSDELFDSLVKAFPAKATQTKEEIAAAALDAAKASTNKDLNNIPEDKSKVSGDWFKSIANLVNQKKKGE